MKHNTKKRKRAESANTETKEVELPPASRNSDDPPPKKTKWINRQRALVFSSRGITKRDRHFIKDLKTIMPHSKSENKMERREELSAINEMCIMKNCNKAIFFESRKKKDLYMWISNVPDGPSAKFLVENVFTMGELKLTGNCLKGSRPILSFDENFSTQPHYALLKELFIQVFGVANHHPKSQPFFDKVISFSVMDNRIWYRNYSILKEDGALAEIGPRFLMNPIKIFEGSFGGETIWENKFYITPTVWRRRLSEAAGNKYVSRKFSKEQFMQRQLKVSYPSDPNDEVFGNDDPFQLAAKLANEPEKSVPPVDKRPSLVALMKKKKRSRGKKKETNKETVENK